MGGKSDALKYAIWKLIKRGLKLKSFGRHTHTRRETAAGIQKQATYALGNLLPTHLTRPYPATPMPQIAAPFGGTICPLDLEIIHILWH